MSDLPPIPQIPCRYCGDVTASQTCGACAFRLWSGENRCDNVVYGGHTCVLELDHPESVPCVAVDGRRGAEPTGRFRCDGPPLVFEAKSLDPDVRDDLKERADNTPGVFMSVRRDVMKALLIERDRLAAVVNRMVMEKTAPADLDPLADPGKLSIAYGMLVYETGRHNCAGGHIASGYAHEPGCGYEPVLQLDSLEGWPGGPAEAESEEPPVPMTQEEKIAYRLAWDARVEEGKRKK